MEPTDQLDTSNRRLPESRVGRFAKPTRVRSAPRESRRVLRFQAKSLSIAILSRPVRSAVYRRADCTICCTCVGREIAGTLCCAVVTEVLRLDRGCGTPGGPRHPRGRRLPHRTRTCSTSWSTRTPTLRRPAFGDLDRQAPAERGCREERGIHLEQRDRRHRTLEIDLLEDACRQYIRVHFEPELERRRQIQSWVCRLRWMPTITSRGLASPARSVIPP